MNAPQTTLAPHMIPNISPDFMSLADQDLVQEWLQSLTILSDGAMCEGGKDFGSIESCKKDNVLISVTPLSDVESPPSSRSSITVYSDGVVEDEQGDVGASHVSIPYLSQYTDADLSELCNNIPHDIDLTPLKGLPTSFKVDGVPMEFGPSARLRHAAHTYCRLAGIEAQFPRVYNKIDKARATRIATAYDTMECTPLEPDTRAAYRALCDETMAQWRIVKATGLLVEYHDPKEGEPYLNPRKAILDILNNNHLYVTPTKCAYGDSDDVTFEEMNDVNENPLLEEVDEYISGVPCLINDIFRVVHDLFGHAKEGFGFRAEGEENAWRVHAAMYSPLARRAMTTELRGQNNWINFGPYGESNRKAGMQETVFAAQKLLLLPEWASWDGAADVLD